jgi:CHAT domain-containing protein
MCVTGERRAARRRYSALLVSLSLLSASVAVAEVSTSDSAPIPIEQGAAVTATQRAGDPVSYVFDAEPGKSYLIDVVQRGLDLIVSVEYPDGDRREFNSPLFRDEPEFVFLENTTAGRYRIDVRSDEPTDAAGAHTISVAALAGGADPRYVEAWRRMSDGARANRESRGEDALEQYTNATRLWRALGDMRREAQSLYSEAMVRYWLLYDWNGAAKQAETAAAAYGQLGIRDLYANATLTRGYSLMEVAQSAGAEGEKIFDDALAALAESGAVHEALGDLYDLAQVENFTGLAYYNRGEEETHDFERAEPHYRRAAELFAGLGEWREELNARHNSALISIDEGYAAAAARTLEEILSDIPAGKDPELRGKVLANLGVAYRDAGEFDAALRVLSEAVKINAESKQFNFEGFALRVLGATYQGLGELDRAREYLEQALEKSADDGRVRASVLSSLGNVAYRKREYVEALDWHRRSLESTTSQVNRAIRQAYLARDLVALRRFEEAIAAGSAAVAAADAPAMTRADSAVELGYAYLGLDRPIEADASFAMALEVYAAGRLEAKQAEALKGRALAARARGDLAAAIQLGEESLRHVEYLRASVSTPELRAFYSAANGDYYEAQIDTLAAAHERSGELASSFALDALSVSERARSRMIVDLLAEAAVHFDRGIPQEVLARERELTEELGALRYRRDRLLEKPDADAEQLSAVVGRMAAIENELTLSAMDVRRNSDHASGAAVKPLTAREIQAQLDDRTVLLQYALGDGRSYAWAVTKDAIRLVALADRDTIETAARQAHDGLKTYRPDGSREAVAASLRRLSDLVLGPLAPLVESKQRLIVAADGALDFIPFGVLPIERDGAVLPLLETIEVTNVPSMSVQAAQQSRKKSVPPKTLAIFADPVFARTDARLAPQVARSGAPEDSRSAAAPLARLAATGAEASAIAELVSPDSRLVVTGFDASRDRVLSAPLGDYRIVHFATHGLVDSRYPGLSALALSQLDAQGRDQKGLLRLQDIYGLDLNADLVVLSGCETALGREIRGEGLIGLVDGFLYAGAQSLVVSLWQVPDRATAELMTRFYGYVLGDGLRPADALRRAQRSIAAEKRWSDPYFWASFIVLGDS